MDYDSLITSNSSPSASPVFTATPQRDATKTKPEARLPTSFSLAYGKLAYQFLLHHETVHFEPSLLFQREQFLLELARRDAEGLSSPKSTTTLALHFMQFLLQQKALKPTIRLLFDAFERDFLEFTDIHNLVLSLPDDPKTPNETLKIYYSTAYALSRNPKCNESALFTLAERGDDVRLYAAFGGQGSGNSQSMKKLRDLFSQYLPFLQDLIDAASPLLSSLSQLPRTQAFYTGHPIEIARWLQDSTAVPDATIISEAAYSFPIIGLLGMAHYCVTCKLLGKTPGQVRSSLEGATGHSQGIVVAAAIAMSDSWESFYDNARLAVEILFWTGFESQLNSPRGSVSAFIIKDSVENGEGKPSSMLIVRGLDKKQLEHSIEACNKYMDRKGKIYLAITNGSENFTVAGPANSLRGLALHLRRQKADEGLDQSRVPFSQRKPVIRFNFLPISAPFHTNYLENANQIIKGYFTGRCRLTSELAIPVFHTRDGSDISQDKTGNIIDILVSAMTTEPVNWPLSTKFKDATHVVGFVAGVDHQLAQQKEGHGVRIIRGDDLESPSDIIGSKAELFHPNHGSAIRRGQCWSPLFQPQIIHSESGVVTFGSKLSTLLGTPPIIVAGMTPTTIHPDFVSTIMNAGYHVELAGGGYHNARSFSAAIKEVVSSTLPGRGVTINLIYVNPHAIGWQIPLIGRLIRDGVPIEGLTIGAGVPSLDIATGYITELGLKHITFKPGSISGIRDVLAIAKANPSFPVILQWTGGRGGGHHSFEDFHAPLLETYHEIRRRTNLLLVAGSGFGDADGIYPYLTGSWSHNYERPAMPFDGVLLGSRMMVANEAHTSPAAKRLIIEASGTDDWEACYRGAAAGVITVQSEMKQPIHKIATRAVCLWSELDRKIFKLPKSKQAAELEKNRGWIIERLNSDFAKPWFGQNCSGLPVDVKEMTYAEVLNRLRELLYLDSSHQWIDESYSLIFFDFARRVMERLPGSVTEFSSAGTPSEFLELFLDSYPLANTRRLHPDDTSWFLSRCKASGQKPVNFMPALDSDFEFWFKKDSLWQSENLDSVIDQDPERVCILHGPVAAQYSHNADESAKDILDGINQGLVDLINQDYPDGIYSPDSSVAPNTPASPDDLDITGPESNSITSIGQNIHGFSDVLPGDLTMGSWPSVSTGWIGAIFREEFVLQGNSRVQSPFRRLFELEPAIQMNIDFANSEIVLNRQQNSQTQTLARISIVGERVILVQLLYQRKNEMKADELVFLFSYDPAKQSCSLSEIMEDRNQRIKTFYSLLWLGQDVSLEPTPQSSFQGHEVILSQDLLEEFVSTLGLSYRNEELSNISSDVFPIDICICVAWESMITVLCAEDLDVDMLKLLHRKNTFTYSPETAPLRVGDIVSSSSSVQEVSNEENGTSVVVRAMIHRDGQLVATVVSDFFFLGSHVDQKAYFRTTTRPEVIFLLKNDHDEAILRARDWFLLDNPQEILAGKELRFQLETREGGFDSGSFGSLAVKGTVYCKEPFQRHVGTISFAASGCHGNPVTDFLARKGVPSEKRRPLKTPGWTGQTSLNVSVPDNTESYAQVSKDYNPVHTSSVFARWANLPSTITHGMYTSTLVRGAVEHMLGDEHRRRFKTFSASFVGMVQPGDELAVEFQHIAMEQGRMVLVITATNVKTKEKVLEGEAEVDQPDAVYLFTGQGSQSQGMGMALYDSSPASKRIWDEADKHFSTAYGNPILLPFVFHPLTPYQ